MNTYQKKYINQTKLVSVHGGHSGQFCNHAQNTLEEIVLKYIESGFEWVGITEHIYPISNELRYPDEVAAGLDVSVLYSRFIEYMKTCRLLQSKYQDSITIMTAFETETYRGYKNFIPYLIQRFKPDYVVGSVHHVSVYNSNNNQVEDICIDCSKDYYNHAAYLLDQIEHFSQHCNGDAVSVNCKALKSDYTLDGVDKLYCLYFDTQYEMIKTIEPAVVGHFDLIRIFDRDYIERLKHPIIWQRIKRNLEFIKEKNLVMDFNLRALMKGASEPYISSQILAEAKNMGINVVIGDDSHGVKDIGVNIQQGIDILKSAGFDTDWNKPSIYLW